MHIKENYSLKNYNTFGIDVKAKYFAEAESADDVKLLLSHAKFKNIPKLILGGGSNILFTKDFDGLVINLINNRIEIIEEDEEYIYVRADAGVIWHKLVLFAVEKNLGGIENLSLIPGKVGAAPIQNIGAYGQELKDVFVSLRGVDIESANVKEYSPEECKFGYRDSIFKRELKNKFIITSVVLKLIKKPSLNISYGSIKEELEKLNLNEISVSDVSRVVCHIRESKLPDPAVIGNAGSFFKNPEISREKFDDLSKKYPGIPGYKASNDSFKIPAGWLIEKAGLKGKREGNVGTHEKQALVIVNFGNAAGDEILKFKDHIKKEVEEKFGIELEEEVNIL